MKLVKLDSKRFPTVLTELPDSVFGIVYVRPARSVLACDYSSESILSIDENGDVSDWFRTPPLRRPYGICVENKSALVFVKTDSEDILWRIIVKNKIPSGMTGKGAYYFYNGLHDGLSASAVQTNGICCDSNSTVFMASKTKHIIAVGHQNSSISVLMGTGKRGCTISSNLSETLLDSPCGIAYDSDGNNLFVADTGNSLIRVVKMGGGTGNYPQTIGIPKSTKIIDGSFVSAGFDSPTDICYGSGKIFVIDGNGSALREIDLASQKISTIWRPDNAIRAVTSDVFGNVFVTQE